MAAASFSLDNLSLMALSVASGFIVDDAIVMIENIVRFIEKGERPLQAALIGSRQIGFTIVSLTVSLIAVFIPLLADGRRRRPVVPGIRHHAFRFHRHFRNRIAFLTPMMCAYLLKPEDNRQRAVDYSGPVNASSSACFIFIRRAQLVFAASTAMLAFTAVTIVASF